MDISSSGYGESQSLADPGEFLAQVLASITQTQVWARDEVEMRGSRSHCVASRATS